MLRKLLVHTGTLLQVMLPESWKIVDAAGTTPVEACFLEKFVHLLERLKLDNDVSKLDVQAAESRLVLRSFLLSPKAKLTVWTTKVQGDGVAKLSSFVLRCKALSLEAEADDVS